jgi:uncharacterized Fe-S cluster protein YjdI
VAHNPPEQKLLSDKITLEDGDMKKEYSNGEVTVVWEPGKCIHSGICVKTLPAVYNPEAKPWIKVENATTAELKEQIDACPSRALTWYMNDAMNRLKQHRRQMQLRRRSSLMAHCSSMARSR